MIKKYSLPMNDVEKLDYFRLIFLGEITIIKLLWYAF